MAKIHLLTWLPDCVLAKRIHQVFCMTSRIRSKEKNAFPQFLVRQKAGAWIYICNIKVIHIFKRMKWKKRNLGPLCHDEPSCQLYMLTYFKCFIWEKKSLTFPLPYMWYMHVCAGTHACLCVCRGQRANGWVSIYFSPSYLYVCGMCIWRRYLWKPEESAGVTGSCELWYRCWQSHQVFLAAELWSQLYSFYILR